MRFIHKWAYSSAKYIQLGNNKDHENRRILYFGFQAIYGDAAKLLLIILSSIILKSFLTTITLAITFATLRMYAGGVHMNTEGKCTFTTLCFFVLPGTIINNIFTLFSDRILILTVGSAIFLFSCLSLYKYAPKDCINRPITNKNEITEFKRNSIVCLIALFLFSMFFIAINQDKIAVAIYIGIVLETLTLIPIGYKIFNLIAPKSVQK